ncbi:MAG: ABC transporter ATP-binding protein [Bacillota bacterium]|nr:ABC transporter ATP-binding protein [Bacillota bacterium]
MIEIKNVSKTFNDVKALHRVDLEIKDGSIFGLVGTNGAGKSTLLRIMAGIIRQDEGEILMDGAPVFENVPVKERIFFIPDEAYYFSNATPKQMARYYRRFYPDFDEDYFMHLLENFDLQPQRKLHTFSKGMKKQVAVITALAAKTKYIFCDETFDGLDPVIRQGVKSLLAAALSERELSVIVASHNLRELEDISDHIGLLHKGGVLLSKDLDDMKLSIHKIQAIFDHEVIKEHFADLKVLKMDRRGSLYTLVVRGEEDLIMETLKRESPLFIEALPLSLEEIFISETEVKGYDLKKLLL